MKRRIENSTRMVIKELNQKQWQDLGGGKGQAVEAETARHLRVIVETLTQIAHRREGERGALGRLRGKPWSQRAALFTTFKDNFPDPLVAMEKCSVHLKQLTDNDDAKSAGRWIIRLFSRGEIDRLRSCQRHGCEKWFYAARANQRVCSSSCRSARWQEGKGQKSHKRAWRKFWLREHALPNIKDRLNDFPKSRPLTMQENRRKEWYLNKLTRYERELRELEKTSTLREE